MVFILVKFKRIITGLKVEDTLEIKEITSGTELGSNYLIKENAIVKTKRIENIKTINLIFKREENSSTIKTKKYSGLNLTELLSLLKVELLRNQSKKRVEKIIGTLLKEVLYDG